MRRRKAIVSTMAVIVVAILLLAGLGCPAAEEVDQEEVTTLTIGSGSAGDMFYQFAEAIAQIINENMPGAVGMPEVTGGATENPILVGEGEIPLAISDAKQLLDAYLGMGRYEYAYDHLRGLLSIVPSVVHILTLEGSGIDTFDDLEGRKVNVSTPDGEPGVIFDALVPIFGFAFGNGDVVLHHEEAVEKLIDGYIDALIVLDSVPNATALTLAASNKPWKIVSIEEKVEEIQAVTPYFTPHTIAAGFYAGQDEDVLTLAINYELFTTAELPEEIAYELVKNIYEHIDIIAETVQGAPVLSPETGWWTVIPLHPGAERYFREKGFIQ